MEAAPFGEIGSNFGFYSNPLKSKKAGMKIRGEHAPITTGSKPEFCLVGPYTSLTRDIMLVQLQKDGKDRMLVTSNIGGFSKNRIGSYDDLGNLEMKKSGDNLLVKIKVEVKYGEYALRISGQVFDFSVKE